MLQNITSKIIAVLMLCLVTKLSIAQVQELSDSAKKLVATHQTDYSITGTVQDEKGQPIAGATVIELSNSVITFTDAKGSFVIKLSPASIKEYTNLLFGYPGKQAEVRNVHMAAFPAIVNVKMEPVKDCKPVVVGNCCAIDVSWTVDRLFEEDKPKLKAKKNKM